MKLDGSQTNRTPRGAPKLRLLNQQAAMLIIAIIGDDSEHLQDGPGSCRLQNCSSCILAKEMA